MNTRKPKEKNKISFLLLFLCALFYANCYTPQEGCRDANAVNYNVKADINCCCIYPQLILSFKYEFDTTSYRQSAMYSDNEGTSYLIDGFQLNLHGFSLTGSAGNTTEFKDTFRYHGEDKSIEKNARLGHFTSSMEIGPIDLETDYNKLSFYIGIDDRLKDLNFKDMKSNNKLIDDLKDIYHRGKWYDGYFRYIPDTANIDSTRVIYISVEEEEVKLAGTFLPVPGRNMNIPLQVDLYEVLKDFKVRSDTDEQEKQLSTGWSKAIKLDSI